MTTVLTVGSEQAAGGGALDGWMLFLAIVSAVGAVIAAATGVTSVILNRRGNTLTYQGNDVQDRVLQLQEEQAAMIPRLEVSDIRFYKPEDSPEVWDVLQEVEQNRRKDERERVAEEERRRKSIEWERQKKEKVKERENDPIYHRFNPIDKSGVSDINPYGNIMMPVYRGALQFRGHRYDGPLPNAVLDFQIINKGKTAAHDISGTLTLEASCFQPLDFPAMDDREISGPDGGFFEVGLGRVTELLPGHTTEYRIALQAIHPGSDKVQVQYEFITPDGINLKDEKAIEWVHSSPQRKSFRELPVSEPR